MKKIFKKLFKFVLSHKLISLIGLIVIIFAGYFGYKTVFKKEEAVHYATAAVEKGALIVSVSGSGQVSASDQIEIKPKASDEVVGVYVAAGQEVKSGTLLVRLDTSDAQRTVQDAEIGLETARVQLEELLEPADELTLLQAENALAKAKQSKEEAEDNIIEGYEDAFNAVTDVFFDLPGIMTDLNKILYSYEIADSEGGGSRYWNIAALENSVDTDNKEELETFIKIAEDNYKINRTKYDENLKNYKNTSRYSEYEIIEALLEETLDVLRAAAETTKSEINMIDFWVDYRSRRDLRVFSKVTEYQSSLKSYTSKINSHLSSLLKIQRAFEDDRQAVVDAEYSIKEKELSLEKLIEGPDDLDIRTKKLTIQQKEDTLNTAKENLVGCYVYAPFDGIVAEVSVKKGDSVSSGTKLLTFITKQKIAEITLNEIDIAKVKADQKATITFDAVEDLTLTGEVVEVDALGTTSQGVVTYDVKIAFDTQDERIKPGMSMSAAIIIEMKQNVLIIPNSAVKYQGNSQYVQVMAENNTLGSQQVEIGISNDTHTEIVSGLNEGDKVVTQTTGTNQSSSASSAGGFAPGGGGTNFMRMMR